MKRRIKELKRELKELETYPAKSESLKLDIKYRYAIGMFMGPLYVLGCFVWNINAFKKETLLECYDLAKKAIDADCMIKEALAKS